MIRPSPCHALALNFLLWMLIVTVIAGIVS
jgi:hypothetical protein